jgi:hypothetical protein
MTLIVPSFDDALVVREADAEVLGMAQLSTRLLADSDATGGSAQRYAHDDAGRRSTPNAWPSFWPRSRRMRPC